MILRALAISNHVCVFLVQIPDEERSEREYAEAALIAVDWMRETARFTSEKVRVTARQFFFSHVTDVHGVLCVPRVLTSPFLVCLAGRAGIQGHYGQTPRVGKGLLQTGCLL